jgi:hypothetical protein
MQRDRITQNREGKQMREYDLNIWFPDDRTEDGTFQEEMLTVQAYIYNDGEYEGEGPMMVLTPEETEILRIQMPEDQYGTDWWYGLPGFLEDIAIPERLEQFLKALPAL